MATSLATSRKVSAEIGDTSIFGIMTSVEYTKARNALGEISDEWAGIQYSLRATPVWEILTGIVGDLPLVSVYFSG